MDWVNHAVAAAPIREHGTTRHSDAMAGIRAWPGLAEAGEAKDATCLAYLSLPSSCCPAMHRAWAKALAEALRLLVSPFRPSAA